MFGQSLTGTADSRRFGGLALALTLAVATFTTTATSETASAQVDELTASSPALTPVSPERFADTRSTGDTIDGQFEGVGQRPADSEYKVTIAGRGSVPAGATGAVINVTAVRPFGKGFFTVHPCATPRPTASALNYTAGVNIANEIVADLSADGAVCVYTSSASHLLIDVVGYTVPTDSVKTLAPARYADSRANGSSFDGQSQAFGQATAGSTTTVKIAGRGAVPASATAAIINVAAVGPVSTGYITVHPCLATTPTASSLNYVAGVNRANELVARVDASGNVCIFTARDVGLIVDVVGYVESGSDLVSTDNARFVDTRTTGTTVDGRLRGGGKRAADSTTNVPIAGRGVVPNDAVAAVVNIAAVGPGRVGFFTVDPCDDPRPNASSLNYIAAVNGANELIAPLDAAGELCVYTSASTHFILDVVGYVRPNADLSITKTDDIGAGTAIAGDTITYTLEVMNNGSATAADVVVTDTLPTGVTLVSTDGCVEDPTGVPTCTLGDIAPGTSASSTIVVTVDAEVDAGAITNTATVTSATGDPNIENNSASAITNIVQLPPSISSDGGGATAALTVDENQTSVTDVQSSDPEGETEGAGLTYSLSSVAGGGADNGSFAVDLATGVVTFAVAPDFEVPGDANLDNAYELQVTVTDSDALTDVQNITVTVANLIDVVPVITSDGGGATAVVSIEENQTTVTDVEAVDGDGETEGAGLTYSLSTVAAGGVDNGVFSVDTTTGALSFVVAPDFEVPGDDDIDNDYEVQVTVTDGAALTDVQDITVTVTNVNDVAPTITSDGGATTATVLLPENQSTVTDVQSVDDADAEGSGLAYSLTTTSGGGTDNGLFLLDPVTGVLAFGIAPDFEVPGDLTTDNDYQVQVTVTDSTGLPGGLTDVQDITVEVTDVNEAPTIFSNGGGATAAVSIVENQTAVTDVQSFDVDGDGEGGGLTYSLTAVAGGGVDNGLFTLDVADGVLSFSVAPDFETPLDVGADNGYDVQVTVTDSGGLVDRQDITVTVTNGNEVPTITSDGGGATAAVDVAENTTAVTDVTSVDDSDSEGAGLTYSLSPTLASFDNGLFSLAADGTLAFLSAPDFEAPADANGDNAYVLQVTVTDSGGLTDSQDIVVTVTGVIDEAPTITSDGGGDSVALSVSENQTAVTDVEAFDLDGETENGGGLVYSLSTVASGGVDNGLLTLDPATGVLSFITAPDFDVPGDGNGDNDYEVQVTVTDGAALTDVQDITVTISNANDVAPTITSDGGGATAAVNAAENQNAVTDVDSVDDVNAEGAGLIYSLTSSAGGADNGLFTVDAATGVLSFTAAPDFETPADDDFDNGYEVQVTVTDGAALTDVQDITVTVTDVNEAPMITSAATADAAENQTAVIDVDSIDDADTESAGLAYTLSTAFGGGADNGLFSLGTDGVLTFTGAPDFEIPRDADLDNDYQVQVTVTDSGLLAAIQNITVTVTNLIDNAPTITTAAAVNAAENQTAVIDIDSADADGETEDGGGLTYALTTVAGGTDNALFSVNPATGFLSFNASPDFENAADANTDNDYLVQVTVTDGGALADTQNIVVTVIGANDAPVITSAATVNAAENQIAVIDVDSSDQDGGAEGVATYSLTANGGGGADNGLFSVDPTTGVVTFKAAPDFETPLDANTDNDYVIQVTVTDGGGLTATQNIVATVTDVNEAPTITSAAAVDAAENQTSVTTVTATDEDVPAQTLGYTITGGADAALFDVVLGSGVLTFDAAPDFEKPADADVVPDGVYEVQVTVTDSGGLTDVQDIVVTVTDVNDAPTITSAAAVDAAENQTSVTTVTATDEDVPAQTLGYTITGGADAALFDVVLASGVLTFDAAPDFENPGDVGGNNVYDVQVTVTDNGTGSLTDVQNIVVTVTDLNDAPTITSAAAVDAAENQTSVTTVTATDEDVPAQTLGYTITGGADAALFDVVLASGVLTFDAAPDFENPGDVGGNNVYDVQVTVTDGLLTDVQDITVTVTDVNEAPTITSAAAVDAAENQTSVTTVTATDEDVPAQTLGYTITGGADAALFDVVLGTGVLTFDAAPDFENPADADPDGVYEVQVTVTDNGTGSLTDVQDIVVTVTDLNDAPTITSSAAVDADENQTTVTDIDSSDQDGDVEGTGLAYSFTTVLGGVDNGLFTLAPATGVVTFILAPDAENPADANTDNDYEVQVTVTDSGGLVDVQDLVVSVTNLNDNAPTITSDGGAATAAVNAAENQTAVTDVNSLDLDGDTEGGGLTYSFTTLAGGGLDNDSFALAADGTLTFDSAPDFENPADADVVRDGVYEVQVTVTDSGSLTDVQDIVVTVTDVNDAPTITSAAAVDAAENQSAVTTVMATDEDVPAQTLGYSITGGADAALFDVVLETGVLTFDAAPDFEKPGDVGGNNVYDVQVTVTDGLLSDVQDITVTVTDVNDAPTITSAATANAAENQTSVIDVESSDDADSEGSGLTYALSITAGGGLDNGLFDLAADGTLTFASAPDFEDPDDTNGDNAYVVQVTVTDSGFLVDVQDITVTVTDVNEAPTITSAATADAAENQVAVINVDASDPEGETENGGGLVYSLSTVSSGGVDNGLFTLNVATGALTFSVAPDFEAPADANTDNDYEVQVTVTDSGFLTGVQDITVSVTNLNDNPPEITSDGGGAIAAVSAAENQTAVTDIESVDLDGDVEGAGLTYSFTTAADGGVDNDVFSLDADGTLTFAVAPDFEKPVDVGSNNVYDVQVTVTDSGGFTDTQEIAVSVTNLNDNFPEITSAATANAAENLTAVIDVQSVDPDGDAESSGLTYSFTTTPGGGVDNGVFSLAADGTLTFAVAPDFEVPVDANFDNVYDVQVTVTDSGGLTDVQDIAVTVTDANDAPTIDSDGGEATASVDVAENQTLVTDVDSSDQDADSEGAGLIYSLTTAFDGGVDNGLFTLNTATGELAFTTAPDFEKPVDTDTDNAYAVQVTVTDSGTATDVQEITVIVTNLNDNAPEIISDGGGATAAVDAAENQTTVTDADSTDADGETENGGGLTYSLTTVEGGVDNGLFTLNSATGAISFITAPNFENPGDANTDNDYEVQVTVTDGASATDRQDITVTVTNLNDNPPVITSNGGGATAAVNAAENQLAVTDVNSSDPDGQTEGFGLTYSLTTAIGGGVDNGLFTLIEATGVLTFTSAPDFEDPSDANADNAYLVQVTVTDSGGLTDVQDIVVTVTDVNDAPTITSAAAVGAAENQTSVTTVTAIDEDVPAQTLGYSITGGADAALFDVVLETGVLTFDAAPDFEKPADADVVPDGVYEVQVTVTDNGTGSLTDVQDIVVTVTDVNEAPTITSDGGGATAALDAAENQTSVTTVTATDEDVPAQTLGYTITGGTDAALFDVVLGTGVLTFDAAPDFENPADVGGNNVYDVQVTVTDGPLSDVQDIAVTVKNLNDSAPIITSDGAGPTAAVSVPENQIAVTDVQSTDADGPTENGGGLTYSLTGGADELLFNVDSDSGVLTFDAAPDFENPADADVVPDGVYEVQVTVTDGLLSDVQDIAVTVIDGNDVPTITSAATANAAENQTAVIDVATNDDSDTEGAGLSYSLTGGADELLFNVDSATGVLTFDAAPDFEDPADADVVPDGVYEVQVTVTDSGSLTDVQDITVTVTDGNDAPTMTPDAPSLTSTPISTTSTLTLVSDLVTASTILDEDAGSTVGIAITGTTGAGTWQYSTNGAAGPWLAIGARSDGSARVLLSTSAIRYVASAATETVTITYRGWDTTGLDVNGAAGVNTVPNGGTTPFSVLTDTAELLVTNEI